MNEVLGGRQPVSSSQEQTTGRATRFKIFRVFSSKLVFIFTTQDIRLRMVEQY
jgi:hypothetical protein